MSNLIHSRKSRVSAVLATAAVSLGLVAGPAQAAPVITGGLVNVTLVDVVDINNNNIVAQIPVGVAANVCDVNAAVLVGAQEDTGNTDCRASVEQLPRAQQRQYGPANN
jgi:hypothetical protein